MRSANRHDGTPPSGRPRAWKGLAARAGRVLSRFRQRPWGDESLLRFIHALGGLAWEAQMEPVRYVRLSRNDGFLGYGPAEWLAPGFRHAHVFPADRERLLEAEARLLATGGSECLEYRLVGAAGAVVWVRDAVSDSGPGQGLIGVMTNIDAEMERRRSEEELVRQLLEHDSLTGLLKWDRFQGRLAKAVAAAEPDREVALLMLDLDHFRAINEALGHPMGDYILQAIAERVVRHAGPGALVARRGGDEFCIVPPPTRRARERAAGLADALLTAISQPLHTPGQVHRLTASIGISVYPRDGREAANLLRYADVATDYAKEAGRNTFRFFTPAMKQAMEERLLLETDLGEAVERSQLVLYYQPLLDASNGRLTGVEALVRWLHPQLGLVPPARFIPLAEETGAIGAIGDWVLQEACRQGQLWHQAGHRDLQVAVNLSPQQFRQSHFPERVSAILAETGFDPASLDLEITESVIMQDPERAAGILHQFKGRDIQIAVDDFGTGYSSLAYLKRFPIGRLKIDRSFVAGCHENRHDRAIVDTIIRLARNLEMEVVAEGVEKEEQLDFLRGKSCDLVQGYLFSPPLPAAQIGALLGKPWSPSPGRPVAVGGPG